MFLALALALANPYAKYGPAKLIIIPPEAPALSVDYATMERCDRAKAELIRQDQANDHSAEIAARINAPVIVKHLVAYCIPA